MTGPAEILDGAKLGGWFELPDGKKVLGELSVSGSSSTLYLHDDEFFHIEEGHRNFQGVLHDRTKVTLLNCTVRSELGSASRYSEHFHFAELFPHFVISGDRHVDATEPTIHTVLLHVDDAEDIFYDFDAFGEMIDARPLIRRVVGANAKRIDRVIPVGPSPQILYFSGRTELLPTETEIGRVRVFHRPFSHPLTSPQYVSIRNQTLIEITFMEPQLLAGALDRVLTLLRFLDLLAGRPQNLDWIKLRTGGAEMPWLDLYWCLPPKRSSDWESRRPHPVEILCNAVDDRPAFEHLLRSWIALDRSRRNARVRFSEGFQWQREFPIDRLIGAANMFDILPEDALPSAPDLPDEIRQARDTSRRLFVDLPQSDERQSVLNALGRLGRSTLRQKVRHRAAIVAAGLSQPLAEVDLVTDEAVKCRNYLVHGSPGSFDYWQDGSIVPFLTKVLEFLFAASDLIDAGWDIQKWRSAGSVLAHPFNLVLHEWDIQVQRIRELKAAGAGQSSK